MSQIDTDLHQLDAALRGEPDADAGWLALVADVRGEVPPRTLSARESLAAQVDAGFPRPARRRALPRWALPGLAVAAAACVAGVGVVALQPGETGTADTAAITSTEAAAPEIAQDSAGAAASRPPAALAPSGGGVDLQTRERRVERGVQLSLRTPARGLQAAADGVVRATQQLGGVVAASQVDATPDGGSASLQLDVPTARLDEAVKRLSALAAVGSLSQSSQDVTAGFVSAQDLLSDARAERRALLRALGRAQTAQQIAALRLRIAQNRSLISRRTGDLNALRRRADTARIDVSIFARGSGAAAAPDDETGWTPGDALRDATRVLELLAGVAIVALAVGLPLVALAVPAALIARAARRRSRDAALGPA